MRSRLGNPRAEGMDGWNLSAATMMLWDCKPNCHELVAVEVLFAPAERLLFWKVAPVGGGRTRVREAVKLVVEVIGALTADGRHGPRI